jgi:hypothetical protein
MTSLTFSEEDFNKNIMEIFNMSEILNDNFKIHQKNKKFYLSKSQKISMKKELEKNDENNEDKSVAGCNNEEILSVEYHVLFHPSYQVPCMFFNAYCGESCFQII